MDPTARFADLVTQPEHAVALDEIALLIAAHAHSGLDVERELGRLDAIAAGCRERGDLDGLRRHLFVDLAFAGNEDDYYDPRNSYLDDVLERRVGIPITLSILAIEVGRRAGVALAGVSMPGHFLVADATDHDVFVDPYAGGEVLTLAGVRARFERLHGERIAWDDSFAAPVGAHAITARLLANLKAIFRSRRDRQNLLWVLRLRGLVPGVAIDERRELASVLAADGRFGEAARTLEDAADTIGLLDGERADEFRAAAVRLRARLN